MTSASASSTSIDKSRTLDTSLTPPQWVQRTRKEPGSLVLRLGEWFEVQCDGSEVPVNTDQRRLKEKAPARRSGG